MTTPQAPMSSNDVFSKWGRQLVPLVCDHCDWNYVSTSASNNEKCPHCFIGTLTRFELDEDKLPTVAPPEEVMPFRVPATAMPGIIEKFTEEIPFPSLSLNAIALTKRARKVYLPIWLVDGTVRAIWEAEAGYPYNVESFRSRYSGGQWQSQKVHEKRTEWEERIGQLRRHYDNITAPALEEHNALMTYLGPFQQTPIEAYTPDSIEGVLVRLPNRSPDDALPDAQINFRQRALQDVTQATEAERLRGFNWKAGYQNLHWTQRLIPVVMSYYLDDDKTPRIVLVNAVTGHIAGEKRGSMRRARRITLIGFAVAAIVASVAIGSALINPERDDIAAISAIIAALITFAALVPLIQVWRFNDRQEKWETLPD